jgi:hypothetical protein
MHHDQPIADGQPIDPTTHISCVRLSWTLISRIQGLLRPDEINDCARQFYLDIRRHLQQEKPPATEDGSHVRR